MFHHHRRPSEYVEVGEQYILLERGWERTAPMCRSLDFTPQQEEGYLQFHTRVPELLLRVLTTTVLNLLFTEDPTCMQCGLPRLQ
jgi:hypothetical protein